jgi:dipeptide transport system substrate-binding protein
MWSYNKAVMNDPHYTDPGKKLLAEAGYKDGFTAELLITPSWGAGTASAQKIAEMVRDNLAEIGVKIEIKSLDTAEFYKQIRNGEHQIALLNLTSINADPNSILRAPLICERDKPVPGNTARWCNSDYQRLVGNAKVNSYYGERGELYKQAQGLMRRKMPWLPLSHVLRRDVVRKEVIGFKTSMFMSHNFSRFGLKDQK